MQVGCLELRVRADGNATVIAAAGSVEQHEPHLPVQADAIATRTGSDAARAIEDEALRGRR